MGQTAMRRLVCPMGPPPTGSKTGTVDAALARVFTISLFTRCPVPLRNADQLIATFSIAFPALRCVLMAFSIFGETPSGRPSFPALPCLPAAEHSRY